MAVLTTQARKKLPSKDFGIPSKKAYPMPDKKHAIVAKAYATRYASPSQKKAIDAKANKVIKGNDPKEGSKADIKEDKSSNDDATPLKMAVNKTSGKVYKHPAKDMTIGQMNRYMAREKRKAFTKC